MKTTKPKKSIPRTAAKAVPINGKATAYAKAQADTAPATPRIQATLPPRLELPPIKSLPAPVKPPSVESPKDLTWLTVPINVLDACLLIAAKKDARAGLD